MVRDKLVAIVRTILLLSAQGVCGSPSSGSMQLHLEEVAEEAIVLHSKAGVAVEPPVWSKVLCQEWDVRKVLAWYLPADERSARQIVEVMLA